MDPNPENGVDDHQQNLPARVQSEISDKADGVPVNYEASASEMLEMFIYDYLKRNNFEQAAESFRAESNLSFEYDSTSVAENDGGFLSESWVTFWPAFYERATKSHCVSSYVDQILDSNQKISLDSQTQESDRFPSDYNYQMNHLNPHQRP